MRYESFYILFNCFCLLVVFVLTIESLMNVLIWIFFKNTLASFLCVRFRHGRFAEAPALETSGVTGLMHCGVHRVLKCCHGISRDDRIVGSLPMYIINIRIYEPGKKVEWMSVSVWKIKLCNVLNVDTEFCRFYKVF